MAGRPAAAGGVTKDWPESRILAVRRMREVGMSMKQVAELAGVSVQRLHQVMSRYDAAQRQMRQAAMARGLCPACGCAKIGVGQADSVCG